MPSAKPEEGRSLADLRPALAGEWDHERNGDLKPTDVKCGSNRKVWWRCKTCGREWQAQIADRSQGRGCPACSGRAIWIGHNDLATVRSDLAEEWDYKRNGDLRPMDVTAHSGRRVWWVCKTCGGEWEARIADRSDGCGCPACGRQRAAKARSKPREGQSLADLRPDLAGEWDHERNGDLKPTDVKCGSNRKVWWVCKTCGHEWEARIANRANGSGCPRCASNGTSFPEQATLWYVRKAFPDAASRSKVGGREADVAIPSIRTTIEYDGIAWHKDKDAKDAEKEEAFRKAGWRPIRVREAETDSVRTDGDTVWCPKSDSYGSIDETIRQTLALLGVASMDIDHGRDAVAIQEQYRGCLRTNSLAATNPDLAAEWHQTRNGRLGPEMFLSGSQQKVWWKCPVCGHEWEAAINNRSNGSGCPACGRQRAAKTISKPREGRSLADLRPDLAEEWNHERNGELKATDVRCGSGQKVWWVCRTCGYEWEAVIASRSQGRGCPACSGRAIWIGHNDLATVRSDLAEEWDYKRNRDLRPTDVTAHSGKRVWWVCRTCGYEWEAVIASRSNGSGCPACARKKRVMTRAKRREAPAA